MKRILCAVLLLLLLHGTAVTFAEPPQTAQVCLTLTQMPEDFTQSVEVYIGKNPGENTATVTLSGLNGYSAVMQLPAGEYFIGAKTAYDVSSDFPVTVDPSSLTAEEGQTYNVSLCVSDKSFYEQVTGTPRYHDTISVTQTPEGFDTTVPAQMGVYLTAPVGFDQTTIVYLSNLYTGETYELKVYAGNLLAAVKSDAASGLYAITGARVAGDTKNRYTIAWEQKELSTLQGVDFCLTVTDTQNPDREMVTPSRDQNPIVQEASSFNGTSSSVPDTSSASDSSTQPESSSNFGGARLLILAFVFLVLSLMVCAFLLWRHRSGRRKP